MIPKVVIRWAPTGGTGWGPIAHFVALAQRLLGAELQEMTRAELGPARRLRRSLFRPARSGDAVVLYIVHHPGEIASLVADPLFDAPARLRAVWIVDSFWTDRTPEGLLANFDLVVFMQKAEAAYYDKVSRGRALFVGWGADVLDLGSGRAERSVDILRIGRQPPARDDDARTALAARRHGLTFRGRPPDGLSYADLMGCYAEACYVIAFSNLAAPAPYTHPSKAYFTGRWTDALAGGAGVAGIAPREDTGIAERLWEGACLDFEGIDLEENLACLKERLAGWSPEVARRNHLNALMRLDWRWGLKRLADRLEMGFPALDRDLERLQEKAVRERTA